MTIITTVGASYVEHMNDDHLAKMEGTCTFLRLISRLAVGWCWRVQENKRWKESALVRKCEFTRFTQMRMQCRKCCNNRFDVYKLLLSNDIDRPPHPSWSVYCGDEKQ